MREVKGNTTAASLTVRHGMKDRLELEVKIPYAYRSDTIVARQPDAGIAEDPIFTSRGKAFGDIDLATRY